MSEQERGWYVEPKEDRPGLLDEYEIYSQDDELIAIVYGVRSDAEHIVALESEVARLRSQAPYVESSGHYCDGMALAWTDAQIAIAEAEHYKALAQEFAEAVEEWDRARLERESWQPVVGQMPPSHLLGNAKKANAMLSAALAHYEEVMKETP